MRALRWISAAALVAALIVPAAANAQTPPPVSTFDFTKNMHPQGFSPFGNTPNLPGLTFTANSDLAFRGKLAFQGHYVGFRIIDISDPAAPEEISFTDCNGNQGDIVVYEDILVRAWNTAAPAGSTCDGEPVTTGFEGVHIFDISDLTDPVLVGSVEISNRVGADALGCGSHTITGVPDLDAGTLVIYNQSAGFCATGEQEAFHVFEIPLDDPANPTTPQTIDLEEAMGCHDSGVILGDANLLACAAHMHTNVFDIGDNEFPGGSLTDPVLLYTVQEEGVCNEPGNPLCNGNWHSAAFTVTARS